MESNSEYVFILKHYPNLLDNSKYVESFKVFMHTFPLPKLADVYESPFKQKIFFNSYKFNWAVTFILKNLSTDGLFPSYQLLLDSGVPKEILIESSKKKSLEITSDEFKSYIIPKRDDDSTYKKFIKNLQKTYLETPKIKTKGSTKFYDKFYPSKNRNKR